MCLFIFSETHGSSQAGVIMEQNDFNQHYYIPSLHKWLYTFIQDCVVSQTISHLFPKTQKLKPYLYPNWMHSYLESILRDLQTFAVKIIQKFFVNDDQSSECFVFPSDSKHLAEHGVSAFADVLKFPTLTVLIYAHCFLIFIHHKPPVPPGQMALLKYETKILVVQKRMFLYGTP